QMAQAAVEARARELALARNRLTYTVLRASLGGVVTAVRFEVGQVVGEGQPVVAIANQEEPEIVVDVPEDHFASFKTARFTASLASAPTESFDVILRELSLQAAPQTRTYRARLKPVTPRPLPLGATAMLVAEHVASSSVAAIPASAITQQNERPALWIVRRADAGTLGTVDLMEVAVHGYRNDEVLVSGPAAGELVVVAGVQKMAPGLQVALPGAAPMHARQAVR
ncbi:MAG TPA: efflux RND transporter periplasmic adaptor subunit, partial [Gammaproteobacteria bacterium]|nr:efflux RND transporter periplasmic adaptor subunit [Gammaproteobacteria bacterium]